jgi:hypothetical protein
MDQASPVVAFQPVGVHGPRDFDGVDERALPEQQPHQLLRAGLVGEFYPS